MNRNFHNLRGSSTHAGNQNPRWRSVFIALVLALAIGSTNFLAQAAPQPQQGFGYALRAIKFSGSNIICVGDKVKMEVWVTRGFENQGNIQQVPGVHVAASMSNASIGQLDQVEATTGYIADFPGIISFKFTAKKAGTTTITFTGTIITRWLGLTIGNPITRQDQVEITVEDCQYKVTVRSDFFVPGMFIGAVFKDAVMTLDAAGLYGGTADVTWTGYWESFGGAGAKCTNFLKTPPPSEATLVGLVNESGQLEVTIVYDAHNLAWSQECTGPGHSDYPFEATATDLTFNVPVNGDVGIKEYQAVNSEPACCGLGGKATITVVAEKAGSGQ